MRSLGNIMRFLGNIMQFFGKVRAKPARPPRTTGPPDKGLRVTAQSLAETAQLAPRKGGGVHASSPSPQTGTTRAVQTAQRNSE
jgi:hypothetical protein